MELKEKTTEKLEEELKNLQKGTGVLAGLLIVLFIVCIYGLLVKNDNGTYTSLIVVPIALSSIVLLNYRKIGAIKTELASRTKA